MAFCFLEYLSLQLQITGTGNALPIPAFACVDNGKLSISFFWKQLWRCSTILDCSNTTDDGSSPKAKDVAKATARKPQAASGLNLTWQSSDVEVSTHEEGYSIQNVTTDQVIT